MDISVDSTLVASVPPCAEDDGREEHTCRRRGTWNFL